MAHRNSACHPARQPSRWRPGAFAHAGARTAEKQSLPAGTPDSVPQKSFCAECVRL